MNREVVIVGASGHGKVVADIIQKSGDQVLGFLDDNEKIAPIFEGFPVYGKVDNYANYMDKEFVIAIGNAEIRERLVKKMSGVKWYTAIHPNAVISGIHVTIGEGTVVMANAVINSEAWIGCHCIINTSSVVEHDNRIEDYVHVSVGAKLAGSVHIGKKTWVGIGASVSNNITISDNCMIGAGAVVVKDIVKKGTYVGVPARDIILNRVNKRGGG